MSEYKFKTGDVVVSEDIHCVRKATVLECKKDDFSCIVLESLDEIDGMLGEGKIVRIGCDGYKKAEEETPACKFKTGDIVVTKSNNTIAKAAVLECDDGTFSCVVLETQEPLSFYKGEIVGKGGSVRVHGLDCSDYEKIEEKVEEKAEEEEPIREFKRGDILVPRKSAITTASKLVYLEPNDEDHFIATVLESKLERMLKIGEIYDRFSYEDYIKEKEEEEKKAEEQEDIFKPGKVVVSHNGRDVVMVIDRESTDFDETFCGVKLSNARYGSDEYKRGHLDRRWDKSKFKLYEGTIKVHG